MDDLRSAPGNAGSILIRPSMGMTASAVPVGDAEFAVDAVELILHGTFREPKPATDSLFVIPWASSRTSAGALSNLKWASLYGLFIFPSVARAGRCGLVRFRYGDGLLLAPDTGLDDDHVIEPGNQQCDEDKFRSPQQRMKDPPQDYACNLDHVGRSPVCTSAKMPFMGGPRTNVWSNCVRRYCDRRWSSTS